MSKNTEHEFIDRARLIAEEVFNKSTEIPVLTLKNKPYKRKPKQYYLTVVDDDFVLHYRRPHRQKNCTANNPYCSRLQQRRLKVSRLDSTN